VSMNAVGFSFLCRQTSLNVNFAGHGLQVLWIHALPDATQVIDVQPLRNLTFIVAIAPPVRIYFLPLVLECTVPTLVKGACPLPATGRVIRRNIFHESVKACHRGKYSTWTNPQGAALTLKGLICHPPI
jgi:membrane-bound metal-dependent hydrolase YbcI (DUF457 family)